MRSQDGMKPQCAGSWRPAVARALRARAARMAALITLCAGLMPMVGPPAARAEGGAQADVQTDVQISATAASTLSLMEARTHSIIAQQSDLLHFLTTRRKFNLYSKVTGEKGTLRMRTGTRRPVWAEAAANWTRLDGTETEAMSATLGLHLPRGERLIYGAMAQIDHSATDTIDTGKAADGWLAGPYMIAQLTDHPLYFEGRLLYGKSRSTLRLSGERVAYQATRWQTRLKLTGEVPRPNVTWRPNLGIVYGTSRHGVVHDSVGNSLPGQMVAIGRVTLGLDFDLPLVAEVGTLSLVGGLSGNWNSTATGETAVALPGSNDGWAKARLGFRRKLPQGTTLGGQAYVEGLGSRSYENYGVALNLTAQF